MVEANGQLTLIVRNDSPSFYWYYYFKTGFPLRA